MGHFARLLAASALAAAAASPAASQQPYPPQSQPYPQPYQQPYGQQGYGYDQQYGNNSESVVGAIIDGLIGNRYNVSDRQAIRQCGWAAVQRAQTQNWGGWQPYPNYNYNLRVTDITDVQRRSSGVRVRGLLGRGWYGNQPWDQRNNYPGGYRRGDFSFRCDVDYRGYVRNVRIEPLVRAY